MRPLEQVLADKRGEAAVLRKHGQAAIADALEDFANEVAEAAEPWLTFIPEADAVIRSNHRVPWFRARFAAWERQGLARFAPTNRRQRQYCLLVVPAAGNLDAVRADAKRAAAQQMERAS
jgi:hypothetical protein